MKTLALLAVFLALPLALIAQAPPNAFQGTTISFNLTPITLPGTSQGTLAGAETDIMVPLSTNNIFGETTLIGNSAFIGGRYERVIPVVASFLQNHTALTGGNFQFALTTSLGVVKGTTESWGGRAGFSLKYAPAGSTSFNVGFEAQANYLPNYAGTNSQHWVPSVAVGPNFRF